VDGGCQKIRVVFKGVPNKLGVKKRQGDKMDKPMTLLDIAHMRASREALFKRSVVDLHHCQWLPPTEDLKVGEGEKESGIDKSKLIYKDPAGGASKEYTLSPTALKQVLGRVGSGLYSVCSKSPYPLVEQIMETWFPQVDEKKRLVVLKHFDTNYTKGVLGVEQSDINTSDVLLAVANAAGSMPMKIDALHGGGEDSENYWWRIIFDEHGFNTEPEDKYQLCMDLRTSDWGLGTLDMDWGVWRQICSNGAIGRVAGRPYFTNRYMGIEGKDLVGMFSSAVENLQKQNIQMKSAVQQAAEKNLSDKELDNLINSLPRDRETSKGLMLKVVTQIEKDRPRNLMQLVNVITEYAKGDTVPQRRLQHEVFAGYMLKLGYFQENRKAA